MGFKDWVDKCGEKADAEKKKRKELDDQGAVYCPKCLSTSVAPQKRGFSVGKALVGGALTGGVGLLAGAIGSNKVDLYCMKCGHKFKA